MQGYYKIGSAEHPADCHCFYGNCRNITITDGTVTATGGRNGAGIGGGDSGIGENITITDGTVTATGGIYGVPRDGRNASTAASHRSIADRDGAAGKCRATTVPVLPSAAAAMRLLSRLSRKEIQTTLRSVPAIHHINFEQDGTTIKREWWEPERPQPNPENPQPNPENPNAPAEESNEVSLGTPGLHVETLEGSLLPFDARRQGSTLRVTSNTLAARLHGTRQALEALREQGVEQIRAPAQNDHLRWKTCWQRGAAGLPWSTTAL